MMKLKNRIRKKDKNCVEGKKERKDELRISDCVEPVYTSVVSASGLFPHLKLECDGRINVGGLLLTIGNTCG